MLDRRNFLKSLIAPAGMMVAASYVNPEKYNDIFDDLLTYEGTADEIAKNESFWFKVQQAFMIDRSMINLNNGGCSPSPTIAHEAMKRYLDYSNTNPVYAMWRILEPQKEGVRAQLARLFSTDKEEIALTRNASEGLQICQLGIDLEKGDEILGTNQDYPRMMATFNQRVLREGLVYKQFSIPTPCHDKNQIVELYRKNITDKTKLILVTHLINLTGQILPVKEICAMARKKNIPVIVDGAHSFAHYDFNIDDLECDYFATSLHKWLLAPIGNGFLYVKKDKIEDLWAMQPNWDTQKKNIRKFEEIGTHPAAMGLAIAESINFHTGIGAKNKEQRLIYLRDRWMNELKSLDNIHFNTSQKEGYACGLANVQIKGVDTNKLASYLMRKHKIITTTIKHEEFEGVRITPNVYTTLDEIDRFTEIMYDVAKNGIHK